MGFLDNILSGLSLDGVSFGGAYRAVLIGDSGAYFENVSGIKSFSPDEIVLFLKKEELTVKGEKLYIKKFCEGDVAICGKISSLERKRI